MVQESRAVKGKDIKTKNKVLAQEGRIILPWAQLRKAGSKKVGEYKGGHCQAGRRQSAPEPAQYECKACGRRITSKIEMKAHYQKTYEKKLRSQA